LSSELGRRSRTEIYKGQTLELCGISPWLHYSEKRPLGRNTIESQATLIHFWKELGKAAEILQCKIALNKKLEKYKIQAPAHFRLDRYSQCINNNCSESNDDSISAGAVIKIFRKLYGRDWAEKAQLLSKSTHEITGGNCDSPINPITVKHYAMIFEISRSSLTNHPSKAKGLIELILKKTNNEEERGLKHTQIKEYGEDLDDAIYSLLFTKTIPEDRNTCSDDVTLHNPASTGRLPIILSNAEITIFTKLVESYRKCSLEVEKIECLLRSQFTESLLDLSLCFKDAKGSSGKEKARNLVNSFCADRKRTTIEIISKIIASDDIVEKTMLHILKLFHHEWSIEAGEGTKWIFDLVYIRERSPEIANWANSNKRGIREIFEACGINPNCHSRNFYYGSTAEEEKQTALEIMRQVESQFGIENLNAGTLGVARRNEPILLSGLEIYSEKYCECKLKGCIIQPPKVGAYYAKCQSLFGSWESTLTEYGINYHSQVIRKKHRVCVKTILEELIEFIQANPDWTVVLLKEKNQTLYRGIYNKRDQGELTYSEHFQGDAMRSAHAEALYQTIDHHLESHSFILEYKKQIDDDWQLRRNFDDTSRARGRLFERWFRDQLIDNGLTEVQQDKDLKENCFMHNKALKGISAGKRPDFMLADAIIDTKTTYFKYQDKTIQQFRHYSKISHNLYCVTLKQDFVHIIDDHASVVVVSIQNASKSIPQLNSMQFDLSAYEQLLQGSLGDIINDRSMQGEMGD